MFKKNNFRFSLSNEYFLFISVVLALVCMLSAGFFIYSYHLYVKQKNIHILKIGKTISNEMLDILEENENVLKFFGRKIADKIDPNDLSSIANLLVSTVDLNIKKMTKSYISWVNIDGQLTVSGKEGILQKHIPDIKNRKYFVTARQNPWSMQIADPAKSIFSNSYVLPSAIGLTNKKREFIGYLVLGLRIDHINKYISKVINHDKANYIILNNQFKCILSSESSQELNKLINRKN